MPSGNSKACDVICSGRFYDFLEKRRGRWGIVLRRLVYEKDRIDPVDPAQRIALDPAVLARLPHAYRHIAYVQSSGGARITQDLPMPGSKALERLYAEGAAWLGAALL